MADAQPMSMLLQSMLTTQQNLSKKLDDITLTMVTKSELAVLSTKVDLSVTQSDMVALTTRVNALERSRLPSWFWPTIASASAAGSPLIAVFLAHLWSTHP